MRQVLHGNATATEAIRRAIQQGQDSLRSLAKRYGRNENAVAKWKRRTLLADLATGPKEARFTVLSIEDEAIIVNFRKRTQLPLDDGLYSLRATIPHLSRSSLHRCSQRHGLSRLPLAVFIPSEFMQGVSSDLRNARRIDSLSEYARLCRLALPLIGPAVATVAVYTMIPIWKDLWFPLTVAPGEATKTVTLGAQSSLGQFVTNWNALLAAMTLAIVPVLVPCLQFSKQLIRGITAGGVK